ncbi:MAG: penicillin-binding protein [Acaryochloridaceae cyanobacterium CSU_5_19]|nr:penicillin-binding protein [Acaryochloridaceae cyanobacterium CSU_5_19]
MATETASSSAVGFMGGVTKVAGSTILITTMIASAAVAGGLMGVAISFRNLPDVHSLKGYIPNETTHIYDINGKTLASLHDEENREVVPLASISPHLKLAVLAIEDSNFYYHAGINPYGIVRATVINAQQGKTVQGASTLTMQLVKNLFLSPQQELGRKVAEAVLAMRLEKLFKKDEILEMYLNQVYWGHNTYGVETASRSYFNKSSADLNLAEAAMMAGIIQAPESYSPFDYDKVTDKTLKIAKERQAVVLARMRELKWITSAEEQAALETPIKFGKVTSFQLSRSPYVTNTVIKELTKRFGKDALSKGGLRIQSTVDTKMQAIAEDSVKWGHQSVAYSADQMALVAVDPRTHFIKAIVGGVDSQKSEFNRATQSLRQPGSAFKPFVYYAAYASGKYSPNSVINDSPISLNDGTAGGYSPQNYDNTFSGSMSLRQALATSRNIPAVTLGQKVGIEKVIDVARIMGIKSPIPPVISLPLGSVDLTPLEMASAYATFANNGWQSEPTAIVQVSDSSGRLLLDNTPKPKLVLNPWAAAALNDSLQAVVNGGTGKAAALGRPTAGKTGTTSSERDVWFVGYVPQLATAVWIGNDDYSPLGRGVTGGGTAAPIWRDFMSRALADTPVESFKPASNFPPPEAPES